MSFYVVVEKVDYTTSLRNAILPKNQMFNLAVYTSLKKAYMEAIKYFNAVKLEYEYQEGEEDTFERYECHTFNLEKVRSEIKSQEKELSLSPCVTVGEEKMTDFVPSEPDRSIYTVTKKSVLIQKFPTDLCIS